MADLTLSTNPPSAGDALTSQDQADIRAGLGLGTAATTAATDYATAAQGAASAAHIASTSNPHATTKAQVGLGNVDNTSDAAKPISTATAAALAGKQDTLVSGTNIKTINGQPVLGSGDLTIAGGGGGSTNLSYTASPTNGIVVSDTGTDATVPLSDGTNAGLMSPAQHAKLAGVAAGATANATDAQLRDRATHTGTQAASTITGLATVATSGAYGDLSGRPTLGTAAPLNVAASGNAAVGEVVKGDDTRLSDAREWTAATVDQAEAEAGTATTRRAWTAERVAQAIAAQVAAWWSALTVGPSKITMSTARLLGRTTAGSGGAEEIAIGSGLSLSAGTLSATGGGGTPGGSDGQIQLNSGGAFAGSNISQDASGRITVAAGTQTTAGSAFTLSYTLNNASADMFGLDINATHTAQSSNSRLLRIRRNGAEVLYLTHDQGSLVTPASVGAFLGGIYLGGSAVGGQSIGWPNSPSWGGVIALRMYTNESSSGLISWNNDTGLVRGAAGRVDVVSNTFGQLRDLQARSLIATQVIQTQALTVATLPAAASWPGGRAYVTDASSPTVGSTVASGGSARAEIMSNGTNWIVTAVI